MKSELKTSASTKRRRIDEEDNKQLTEINEKEIERLTKDNERLMKDNKNLNNRLIERENSLDETLQRQIQFRSRDRFKLRIV